MYHKYPKSVAKQTFSLCCWCTMFGSFLVTLAQFSFSTMAYSPNDETEYLDKRETPEKIKITAITAANGASMLECWELSAPFQVSSEAGVVGAAFAPLTDAGNVTYAIIPPKFDGGLHNAPQVQYVPARPLPTFKS